MIVRLFLWQTLLVLQQSRDSQCIMPKFSIDCDCNAIAKMPEATIILLLP